MPHPAWSRAFPTRLPVFPSQGVQEDQSQQQGESTHAETGPRAHVQAVLGLLRGDSAHGTGHRLALPFEIWWIPAKPATMPPRGLLFKVEIKKTKLYEPLNAMSGPTG